MSEASNTDDPVSSNRPAGAALVANTRSKQQTLIEAQTRIRNARNELVLAVMALELTGLFKDSTAAMKETIGDLLVAEKHMDKFIDNEHAFDADPVDEPRDPNP